MKKIYIPDEKKALTFQNVFRLWRLNAKLIATVVAIVTIFAIAETYIVPSTYKAYSSIIPPESPSGGGGLSSMLSSLGAGGASISSLGGLASDSKMQLFNDYLKSREISKFIADTLRLDTLSMYSGLEREKLYEIVSQMIFSKVNHSGLIVISSVAETPYFPSNKDKELAKRRAADIANMAVAGLDEICRTKTVSKAHQKRVYIEKMLAFNRRSLDSIDIELENFGKRNKAIAIEDQAKALMESSVDIGTELGKAEAENNLNKLEYQPNSPAAVASQKNVESLRKQYMQIQNGGYLGEKDYSFALSKMPELSRIYTSLLRDKKILEQVNLYLETQHFQEAIEEQSDVPQIEQLDLAVPAIRRDSPSRVLAAILGFFLSTAVMLCAVTFLAMKRQYFIMKEKDNGSE